QGTAESLGVAAKHTGHVDFAHAAVWASARTSDRKAHSAHDRGRAASRAWFVVSSFASHGAQGLDQRQVGNVERAEAGVQVLQAHASGPGAVGCEGIKMEARSRSSSEGDVAGSGG